MNDGQVVPHPGSEQEAERDLPGTGSGEVPPDERLELTLAGDQLQILNDEVPLAGEHGASLRENGDLFGWRPPSGVSAPLESPQAADLDPLIVHLDTKTPSLGEHGRAAGRAARAGPSLAHLELDGAD